ncbi:MAG TPA: DUF4233 domain-containing protein [Mycobacteriales bacterium]|nr:DUF4233 domain-containing protein [Mycobacteriales bacterium]
MEGPPDPPRGLLGIGAAGLVFEAIVVFLAAVAMASPGHGSHAAGIGYLLALGVILILLGGLLRRRGGVAAATVVQVLVIAAGVVTWPMYVVGVFFAAIWAYWLRLRRTTT